MEYHFHYGTPTPTYEYSRHGYNILPQMHSKMVIASHEIVQSMIVRHAPISREFYGRGHMWLSSKYKPYQSKIHAKLAGGGIHYEKPAHDSYLYKTAPFRDDMFVKSHEYELRKVYC